MESYRNVFAGCVGNMLSTQELNHIMRRVQNYSLLYSCAVYFTTNASSIKTHGTSSIALYVYMVFHYVYIVLISFFIKYALTLYAVINDFMVCKL